tara:strand:+ start:3577 stop:4155 length:579 start_codon:yes stop_codon:yes gene_type:complete
MYIKRDDEKLLREDIIEKPGRLAAKIIFNIMCDKKFNLSFIGNTMGNTLYTVQLNNEEKAIVGFTDEKLLHSYVNRSKISKTIKNIFGGKIVSVTMNICTLGSLIDSSSETALVMGDILNYKENNELRTIIINPNDKDFFIPFHIQTLSERLLKEGIVSQESIKKIDSDNDVRSLEYDNDINRFVFEEENNF